MSVINARSKFSRGIATPLSGRGGVLPLLRHTGDIYAYWDVFARASLTIDAEGRVSEWRDLLHGYPVSQATLAAQLLYSSTSFGGDPGLSAAGAQYLTGVGLSLPAGNVPCEIIVLMSQEAAPGDNSIRYVVGLGASAATARRVGRSVVSGVNRARILASNQPATVSTVDFSGRRLVRGIFGAGASTPEVDGVSGAAVSVTLNTVSTRLTFGASDGSPPTNFHIGQIAAVLITPLLSAETFDSLKSVLL